MARKPESLETLKKRKDEQRELLLAALIKEGGVDSTVYATSLAADPELMLFVYPTREIEGLARALQHTQSLIWQAMKLPHGP